MPRTGPVRTQHSGYPRDVTAFEEFWDEDADYVAVDGTLIIGRREIQQFFRKLAASSGSLPQQIVTIERVRFLAPELAIIDGAWTITGASDGAGKEMAPIRGRGVEIVQKKRGRWWFVATREMVVFQGK